MTLALISNIANYLKYNCFWDCDSIDNVTLQLWQFSDFCSRHTVGVAGDDIMFYILVIYILLLGTYWLKDVYIYILLLGMYCNHIVYTEVIISKLCSNYVRLSLFTSSKLNLMSDVKRNHYKILTLLPNVLYQQKCVNKVHGSKYFKQATCHEHCKDAIYTERRMVVETLWTWHGKASPICISLDKCCRRELYQNWSRCIVGNFGISPWGMEQNHISNIILI